MEEPPLFNSKFVADIYDQSIKNDLMDKWWVNRSSFILNYAEKYGKKGILNLGCGTGKLTIFLAKQNFNVVGLDLSEAMLDIANRKMAQLSNDQVSKIKFIQGDMTNFSISQKFSFITISGGVFCHLRTQEEQLHCFQSINQHLTEDGILCLDTMWPSMKIMVEHSVPNIYTRYFRHSFLDNSGNKVDKYDEVNYDLASQHLNGKQIYHVHNQYGDNVKEYELPMNLRMTFPSEMRLLFQLSGFTLIAENSGYTEAPCNYPERIVWTAKKNN